MPLKRAVQRLSGRGCGYAAGKGGTKSPEEGGYGGAADQLQGSHSDEEKNGSAVEKYVGVMVFLNERETEGKGEL